MNKIIFSEVRLQIFENKLRMNYTKDSLPYYLEILRKILKNDTIRPIDL
jgi:hypothetical protein